MLGRARKRNLPTHLSLLVHDVAHELAVLCRVALRFVLEADLLAGLLLVVALLLDLLLGALLDHAGRQRLVLLLHDLTATHTTNVSGLCETGAG